MASYYSRFPEVVALLQTLANKEWKLAYTENQWMTTVSGRLFEIEQTVIHFNTRMGAQLKLNNTCKHNPVCVASPADALLHELLHVHSMLVKTEEFIAQGGLNSVTYPYKHEYSIISSERALYAHMSRYDQQKRPSRHTHRSCRQGTMSNLY